MIGEVVAILEGGDLYNCKAILKVWENKAESTSHALDFSVHREGLHFGDDRFPGRITVLT